MLKYEMYKCPRKIKIKECRKCGHFFLHKHKGMDCDRTTYSCPACELKEFIKEKEMII